MHAPRPCLVQLRVKNVGGLGGWGRASLQTIDFPLAAAHNAGAALLLLALVVLNFFAFLGLRPSS